MYTIIIFYIIGFIYFIKEWGEVDLDAIMISLFQSVLFAIVGLIISISLPVKYETESWKESIISLKDNNSIKGNFFLGSGMINGQMKYVYYQQNEDSTLQMWQANYYDALIKYTTGQPSITIIDIHRKKSFWNGFAIDINSESGQKYIFEIPKGSVKNAFDLDAQ